MSKRFRLRISKIIFSINPCSSKDHSNPVSSIFRFSTVSPTVLLAKDRSHSTTTGDKPHRSFLKRHVSAALTSVGCCRSRSKPATLSDHDDDDIAGSTESSRDETFFQWEKQDNWHVIAKVYDDEDVVVETPRRKIYTSSVSGRSEAENDDVLPPPPPPPSSAESKKKKKRRCKKKTTSSAARSILLRISTSSAESGLFSNEEDEDEETETLVSSSRSLSTSDSSSEFNTQLETIREVALDHSNNYPSNNNKRSSRKKKKKKKPSKRCVSKQGRKSSSSASSATESAAETTPARLSMFQRMIPCTVDGKVRESFAVVKKSADPYEDFKRSMMEMILEKQMFEDKDLEQLLHCFLSLNSRDHHGIIVRAFSEIWEILFSSRRVSRAL